MQAQSIVVLTGAGISAESGIKTFRDQGGLWENHRLEDVCTPEAFKNNPSLVQQFYNARRKQLINQTQPNAAHVALANFARRFKGQLTLITQNVDDLHERAGSPNVIHMHGELLKARCNRTFNVLPWHDDITEHSLCPCCSRTGTLRPHIVWFGEIPFFMGDIEDALTHCDLFIAIGTSGQVYPAAGFAHTAMQNGAATVELNLDPGGSHSFEQQYQGLASQLVPEFFSKLLKNAA